MSANATPAGPSGRRLDRVWPTGDIEPGSAQPTNALGVGDEPIPNRRSGWRRYRAISASERAGDGPVSAA
jgi:hypothetical protein